MKPLPDHSLYVTSADAIAWGGFLPALTLVIHGFGMLLPTEFQKQDLQRIHKRYLPQVSQAGETAGGGA